jgi:formylglycine-generating enzyme required for sulfatase activity
MAGNAYEWVQDWYPDFASYNGAPTDGSAWESWADFLHLQAKESRVRRGGSWSSMAWDTQSAARDPADAGDPSKYIGFRPVR